MAKSDILAFITQRNPNEPEFLQAAEEVIDSVLPVIDKNPEYKKLKCCLNVCLSPNGLFLFGLPGLMIKMKFR
jgi:glutamate dehydrogenase (NADP+)